LPISKARTQGKKRISTAHPWDLKASVKRSRLKLAAVASSTLWGGMLMVPITTFRSAAPAGAAIASRTMKTHAQLNALFTTPH
jgi:hypothetical protein